MTEQRNSIGITEHAAVHDPERLIRLSESTYLSIFLQIPHAITNTSSWPTVRVSPRPLRSAETAVRELHYTRLWQSTRSSLLRRLPRCRTTPSLSGTLVCGSDSSGSALRTRCSIRPSTTSPPLPMAWGDAIFLRRSPPLPRTPLGSTEGGAKPKERASVCLYRK